jgi:hypothetical protein
MLPAVPQAGQRATLYGYGGGRLTIRTGTVNGRFALKGSRLRSMVRVLFGSRCIGGDSGGPIIVNNNVVAILSGSGGESVGGDFIGQQIKDLIQEPKKEEPKKEPKEDLSELKFQFDQLCKRNVELENRLEALENQLGNRLVKLEEDWDSYFGEKPKHPLFYHKDYINNTLIGEGMIYRQGTIKYKGFTPSKTFEVDYASNSNSGD